MGTLDSREYDRLVERDFRPYSKGHREMYLRAIRQILEPGGGPTSIFEAGFGIGYGLHEMLKAGAVSRYVGCEPQVDSYNYTVKEALQWAAPDPDRVQLIHSPFTEDAVGRYGGEFAHVFCIEVIEHVPLEGHAEFLQNLRYMLSPHGVLWFSTPCKNRVPREGVRTTEEWEALLKREFDHVDVDRSQWTYLYRCWNPA